MTKLNDTLFTQRESLSPARAPPLLPAFFLPDAKRRAIPVHTCLPVWLIPSPPSPPVPFVSKQKCYRARVFGLCVCVRVTW